MAILAAGTDVMIFKIFSPKNRRKIGVLTQIELQFCKILIITLVFEKKTPIFSPKIA
jgi:hypothetical protein